MNVRIPRCYLLEIKEKYGERGALNKIIKLSRRIENPTIHMNKANKLLAILDKGNGLNLVQKLKLEELVRWAVMNDDSFGD